MALHSYYKKISGLILILSLINVCSAQSSSTTNQCLNYCSTGGICLRTKDGPKCICSPKWTGERCDTLQDPALIQQSNTSRTNSTELRNDPCEFAPENFCQHDGFCYVNNNMYACHCRYPYGGENCELPVCYEYCFYNGACSVGSDGKATCKCSPDRTGDRCETLIATTTTTTPATTTTAIPENSPCKLVGATYCNSGTCVVVNNRATCQCQPTHTGMRCETPTGGTTSQGTTIPPISTSSTTVGSRATCYEGLCQNGGKCYNNGNTYFCFCNSRYTGKNCEYSI